MGTLRVIYATRKYNPGSWLIRWALPRSRLALALASHAMIVDGDDIIEANMMHGVRVVPAAVALAGHVIVGTVDYQVPDAAVGIAWARSQVCRYVPPSWAPQWLQPVLIFLNNNYDWRGALGLVAPDRDWQDPAKWFCFELAAGALEYAGRTIFASVGHITGTVMMLIKP